MIKIYYIVMLVAGIINFIRNIVYAVILGPTELGYYSLAMLIAIFGLSFCSLGLYEGSLSTFPLMYGQGKKKETEILRNKTSGFILLFSTVLIILSFFLAFVYPFQDINHRIMIIVCAIFSGSQLFLSFLLVDIRSRLMTLQFGWLMFCRSGFSFVIGVLAAIYFGFLGIIVGEIFISIILICFVIHYRMEKYHLVFGDISTLKSIFNVGIPLMINGLLTNIASNLEKFFIVAIFGTYLFGQYSFAMILVIGAQLFQGIVYQHIGPEILHRIGKGEDVPGLLLRINQIVIIAGGCFILLWYPFVELSRIIIFNFFQGYDYAINLLSIVYVGAGFIMMSHYEHFIVAYRKTNNILYSNLIIIVITFVFLLAIYLLKLPLIFFAIAFVIGRAIYFLITYYLAKSVVYT